MDIKTILGSRIATAVNVNSLLVPANSLATHLQRFTDPALFNSDGMGKFGLSKSGSLARVKHQNRFYALTSFHQVSKPSYNFDQLCIVSSDRKMLLTSHRATFPTGSEDQNDDFDIVLFEFTDVVNAGKLPRSGWYDVTSDIVRESTPEPLIVCCIGYPGYRNNIDFEAEIYPISPNAVWGHQAKSGITGRLSFEPNPEIDFPPDGMSGAPVFGIALDSLNCSIFLAGILTNASNKRFNFIPLLRIKAMLAAQRA